MFLVTNLDPENEYVVFDVRGNTKGLGGLLHNCVERGNKQSNKRSMARTLTGETKRGRPKKGQKTTSPQEAKKGERASPSCGRKLSHLWPL
jgi:hypothetical protein